MKKVILFIISIISCINIYADGDVKTMKSVQITPSDLQYYDKDMIRSTDGITYILFTCPSSDDGICYRLQILDKDGNRTLGRGGKVISSEKNRSWTTWNQYVQTDQDGNAFVAVQDMRFNNDTTLDSLNYTIYKYAPTGDLLWQGTTLNDCVGEPLSAGLVMVNTEDNGLLCAYRFSDKGMVYDYAHIEKLDKDGQCVWKKNVFQTKRDSYTHPYPFLLKSGENEVMMLWTVDGNIQANLLNTQTGEFLLENPKTIYTGGFASSKIMEVVDVQPGPDDGALISVIDGNMQGRLVYVDGDLIIGLDGKTAGLLLDHSGNTDYVSNCPTVTYCPDDNTFACVYKSFDYYNKKSQAVYYQKLEMDGEAVWDNGGKAFVPLQEANQYGYFQIRDLGDGSTALFYLKYDNSSYKVNGEWTVFDKNGNACNPVEFAKQGNSKVELWVSEKLDGDQFVTAWDQKNTAAYTLFTETVTADPTLSINQVSSHATPSDQIGIYSVDGVKHDQMQKGINIIRQRDGKTIKVVQ